jgi:NADH-quinone oxidoreductase subunit J
MFHTLYFWVFATIAGLCGVGVILSRNSIRSAISLVVTMVALAALFLQLHSEFLAYLQVIVYAGAVMVLIIFTVTLLNLQRDPPLMVRKSRQWGIALVFLFLMMFCVYQFLDKTHGFQGPPRPLVPLDWGGVPRVARALFTTYLFPVEFVAILLTGAVVGAAALARRGPEEPGCGKEEEP